MKAIHCICSAYLFIGLKQFQLLDLQMHSAQYLSMHRGLKQPSINIFIGIKNDKLLFLVRMVKM